MTQEHVLMHEASAVGPLGHAMSWADAVIELSEEQGAEIAPLFARLREADPTGARSLVIAQIFEDRPAALGVMEPISNLPVAHFVCVKLMQGPLVHEITSACARARREMLTGEVAT